MPDRTTILETIDRFWEARLTGDAAEVRSFLSPGATYEMVGAKTFADPTAVGPAPAATAADQLVGDFKLHRVDQLTAIVDGPRAAVVVTLQASFRGGAVVTTEACDIWEFDDAGKVKSLKQFVDTELVHKMIDGRA